MTMALIALNPSRRFIARIEFKVFVFLKLFLVLSFGMFYTVVGKVFILRILFCLEF